MRSKPTGQGKIQFFPSALRPLKVVRYAKGNARFHSSIGVAGVGIRVGLFADVWQAGAITNPQRTKAFRTSADRSPLQRGHV